MTDPDLTLVAALLDRSGSMRDDKYGLVCENRPIDTVPPLTRQPPGMTALLDGIGRFISETGSAGRPARRRSPG